MSLAPRLDLRQTQSLVMTPQLQQAIKLLALSNLELETHIATTLEANPLVELGEVSFEEGPAATAVEHAEPSADDVGNLEQALDIDPAAVDHDGERADPQLGLQFAKAGRDDAGGGPSGDPEGATYREQAANADVGLAQHLSDQLPGYAHDAREAMIASRIIHELEDTGYLCTELASLAQELGVPLAEAERALALVQSLDPAGVGARTLRECLVLQAKDADRYDPCMARLIDNLDLVADGGFVRLKRLCDVDDEDLAQMLAELRGYDPKPGCRYCVDGDTTIVPDLLVTKSQDGAWDVRINEASLPRLIVNHEYYVTLRKGCADRRQRAWLDEQLSQANWLTKALDQRQKTILKTAAAILQHQSGFLEHGVGALRILTLREIAETIDMHESTVSRVTNNKYLHCPRGTFELKYFFSSGVATTGADGGTSAAAVKARIKALTDAEGGANILSDDSLVDRLQSEGIDIARRTVAKYREAMGIGSSVQRRRQKKLRAFK